MRWLPRHHRLGALPLGLLAVVLAASTAFAQPVGVPAVVEHLLQGLASGSCATRWAAIEEYIDRVTGRVATYAEPAQEITARLRERAQSAAPLVAGKVRDVTAYTDELKAAVEQVAKLSATVRRSGSDRDQWRRQLDPLAKAVDDPATPYLVRQLAASLIAANARKSEAARAFGWSRPVRRLLESKEPMARLVGSIQAARGNLLRDQAPSKGHIVPELMRGLDADSFAARYDSAHAMLAINGMVAERFCVDPSDPPAERADGVRAWRAWWDQHKAGMAGDRIPQ